MLPHEHRDVTTRQHGADTASSSPHYSIHGPTQTPPQAALAQTQARSYEKRHPQRHLKQTTICNNHNTPATCVISTPISIKAPGTRGNDQRYRYRLYTAPRDRRVGQEEGRICPPSPVLTGGRGAEGREKERRARYSLSLLRHLVILSME